MTDAEQARQHAKMYRDMYEGDGPENPSITTRLTVLEGSVDRIVTNSQSLKWWAMGIIGSVLGDAILHVLKH